MLAEETNSSLAHVLNPAHHRGFGFFLRFERKNFMGLDFQDLRKSRMTSAVRFLSVFHG